MRVKSPKDMAYNPKKEEIRETAKDLSQHGSNPFSIGAFLSFLGDNCCAGVFFLPCHETSLIVGIRNE